MKFIPSWVRRAIALSLVVATGHVLASTASTRANSPSFSSTFNNLSIDWRLSGDSNRNSKVQVKYRKYQSGDPWKDGMNLQRVTGSYAAENHHSGSILDLEANTEYEVILTLTDLDGSFPAEQPIRLWTRRVPTDPPYNSNRPPRDAYNNTQLVNYLNDLQAGDIIRLHTGNYFGFTVPQNGIADKPIVIKAAASATPLINGNVDLNYREYVHLEGLTIVGTVNCGASKGLAIRRNTIDHTRLDYYARGISCAARSENAHIADNIIKGPESDVWLETHLGERGPFRSKGILTNGPGHVIEHNEVTGFGDAISLMEGDDAQQQYNIDINNNKINVAVNDAIEADFCLHNCRVMRNSIVNAFTGISFQPTLRGPTYSIRNVMFNVVYQPFKLHNYSTGNVIYHNTSVKNGDALAVYTTAAFSNTRMRNNIFLGTTGTPYVYFNGYQNHHNRVIHLETVDLSSLNFDYDAFGLNDGSFNWRINSMKTSSLSSLQSKTTARNAIQVNMGIFNNSTAIPSLGTKNQVLTVHSMPNLTLRTETTGMTPVDSAEHIPNVNKVVGADRGAYEVGETLPHYGPRTSTTTSTAAEDDPVDEPPRPRRPHPRF